MKFQDIINARDNLFTALRKKIADNQYQKIMDELTSGNLNSGNSNKKKNKNKKYIMKILLKIWKQKLFKLSILNYKKKLMK